MSEVFYVHRTNSPDKETAGLRKSIKQIIYHPSSPPVNHSQMSIISIKAKEKCVVHKLRCLGVKRFVTTTTPAWRSVYKKILSSKLLTTIPHLQDLIQNSRF